MARRAVACALVWTGLALTGSPGIVAEPLYPDVAPSPAAMAGEPCAGAFPGWAERLSLRWREEYLARCLSRYLFQRQPREGAADKDEPGRGAPSWEMPVDDRQRSSLDEERLEAWCDRADACLFSGHAPEALAYYSRCSSRDPLAAPNPLRPALGALKANLMMARKEEARGALNRLRQGTALEGDPTVMLLEGILAGLEGNWEAAGEKLLAGFPAWHPGANVESLAGYALLRQQRYRDAGNVLRVAGQSAWAPVRHFALLSLADAERGLLRCEEAEAILRHLVEASSPLGFLGLAETRIAQGDLEGAAAVLDDMVLAPRVDEYWQGVALTYRAHLSAQKEAWAEAETLAWRAERLVLAAAWQEEIRNVGLRALDPLVREQGGPGKDPAGLIVLGERWKHLVPSLPVETRILLEAVYDRAGLTARQDGRVDGGMPASPEHLYEVAWGAWASGNYDRAQHLLDRLRQMPGHARTREANLLEACLLYRRHQVPEAKQRLAEPSETQDLRLLEASGSTAAALNMVPRAIDDYRRALELASGEPDQRRPLHKALAELLYRQGKHEEALAHFRKAQAGEDETPAPGQVLSLLKLNRLDQAQKDLGRFRASGDRRLLEELAAADALLAGEGRGPLGK